MTSFAALSSSLSSSYLSPPSLPTSSSRILHPGSPSPSLSPFSSPSSSSSPFYAKASAFSWLQRPAGAARLRRVNAQKDGASGFSRTESKPNSENTPSWAKPGSEELPPWAKNEAAKPVSQSGDLPFFVYLIASCLVAIAAVGSIFEYFNKNAIFGVVQPDSPLWAPILGFFAVTGLPSAGFLWHKAISLANKASEEQDKADGVNW